MIIDIGKSNRSPVLSAFYDWGLVCMSHASWHSSTLVEQGRNLQAAVEHPLALEGLGPAYPALRTNAVAVLHARLLYPPTVMPIEPGPDSLLDTLMLLDGPALLGRRSDNCLRTALADLAVATVAPTFDGQYRLLCEALHQGALPHQLLHETAVRAVQWVQDLDAPLGTDFVDLAQYVMEQIHAMATPGVPPPLAILSVASSVTAHQYKVWVPMCGYVTNCESEPFFLMLKIHYNNPQKSCLLLGIRSDEFLI